jgi:hypothetical protein
MQPTPLSLDLAKLLVRDRLADAAADALARQAAAITMPAARPAPRRGRRARAHLAHAVRRLAVWLDPDLCVAAASRLNAASR